MHFTQRQESGAEGGSEVLHAEQTKLLYAGLSLSIPVTLANAALLAAVQWPVIDHRIVLGWFSAIVLVSMLRGLTGVAFQRRNATTSRSITWARRFFFGAFSAGFVWSAAAIFLFPEGDIAHQVFLAFVLAGMTAGAVTTLSSIWLVVLAFLLLSLIPLALRFFLSAEPMALAMGTMVTLFLLLVLASARRIHNTIRENISSRIEVAQYAKSLSRSKYILDNTLDMIFMFEPDTLKFVYLNKGAVTSMGYTREELLQMTPEQIEPRLPREDFCEIIAPLLSGERASVSLETLHRRKDGSDFPVEIFLQLVKEPGNKGLFVSIVRDISERKKIEKERQRQHRLLDIISRMQSRFIREADPYTVFTEVLEDILALTKSGYGFIGEILHSGERQPSLKMYAVAGKAGDHKSCEGRRDNVLEAMAWADVEALFGDALLSDKPLVENHPGVAARCAKLPGGHPGLRAFLGIPLYLGTKLVGVVGLANRSGGYDEELVHYLKPVLQTCTQIIDALRNEQHRRHAERLQQESATRIRAIVDTAVDGIITFNAQGVVESFNPAAEDIFGYRKADVIGQNINMLMAEPYCSEHERYVESYAASHEVRVERIGREIAGRRKDGANLPLELTISEMQLSDQRMFTGIVRDITERKKIERMKNEFVSTVSHELRTPLTSIIGSLGLIVGGDMSALPDHVKRMVGIAHQNSERLICLINDILDMEKIAAGNMDFNIRTQMLAPLIARSVQDNRAYAERLNVCLELTETVEGAQVNVDAERLLQVLSNLLSNAAKFSPHGGCVEVTMARREGSVRVSVIDQGEGVPEAFRPRIFQKFSQADSSDTRKKGGTGLGLSISKSLLEKMGGTIGFDTRNGVGTTFYFDLPLHAALDSPPPPPLLSDPAPFTVLVCEDNRDKARCLCTLLHQGGFETDVACDARQAKAMLTSKRYSVMTLAPDFGGERAGALIRELRAQEVTCELPILVVPFDTELDIPAADEELAAVEWVGKPIDEAQLVDTVQRALNGGVNRPRLLHIEDDANIRHIVREMCRDIADFDSAQTLREARAKLELNDYSLVVLDLGLPDGSGWKVLSMLKALASRPRVVVLSASELSTQDAQQVAVALVKSRTSNQELLKTIRKAIRCRI